jgi:hypothetical protein
MKLKTIELELEPTKAEFWVSRIGAKIADSVESIIALGSEFIAAKKALPHGEFGRLVKQVNLAWNTVNHFMAVARHEILSNSHHSANLPCSWKTLYALSRLDPPRLALAIDRGEIRPDLDEAQARAIVKSYKQLDVGEKPAPTTSNGDSLFPEPDKLATFNQVNDNIGWARWSWNPVTGCLHNCDYCYARDIAERFYPQKFEPTFFPERLDAPANTKLPPRGHR